MKKIFLSLLFCVITSMFISISVISADETPIVDTDDSINVLNEFLETADIDEIEVIDTFGGTAKEKISKNVKNYLSLEYYDKVIELLERHNLSLKYGYDNVIEDPIGVNGIGSTVNRTEHIYHLEYDISNTFRKEWVTTMHMSYRENADGTFTALGDPSIDVSANFGAAFSEEISRISTGYTYVNNRGGIDFNGSYRMRARIVVPIKIGDFEIPIGRWYDWGMVSPTYNLR